MGDALKRVVSRAISDAAFRRQLQADPKAALREFNLSAAEIGALTSGDASKLTALGIDQRMSRMLFVQGDLAQGSAAVSSASDAAYASSVIDAGAGTPGGTPELESVDVSGGAGGGLGTVDPGSSNSGMPELERLAGDPAAENPDVWTTGPYGTGSDARIDGSSGEADFTDDGSGGLPQGGADHTTL